MQLPRSALVILPLACLSTLPHSHLEPFKAEERLPVGSPRSVEEQNRARKSTACVPDCVLSRGDAGFSQGGPQARELKHCRLRVNKGLRFRTDGRMLTVFERLLQNQVCVTWHPKCGCGSQEHIQVPWKRWQHPLLMPLGGLPLW